MAEKRNAEQVEAEHRALAAQVVDLFMPAAVGLSDEEAEQLEIDNEPKIIALFEKLSPVDAAAVAVQVCYELDPEEIADFLALLEQGPDSGE